VGKGESRWFFETIVEAFLLLQLGTALFALNTEMIPFPSYEAPLTCGWIRSIAVKLACEQCFFLPLGKKRCRFFGRRLWQSP